MKELMSGNEAIARGAFECGARFAAGYPGTPSTEIMEAFANYPGVYAEWSPNEKVAMEVGIGAAVAGARAMVVMKHVGVNVAADPLMTASYTGTNGALVVITADDPSLHSSQNEQDNRHYARFAKIPMLEPSDSQEAKEFIKLAFDLSEQFDTPVFLRTTTRVSHSKSVVTVDEPQAVEDRTAIRFDAEKFVMVPMNARKRRIVVEKRIQDLRNFAETFAENRMELNSPDVGIITAGISYQYAKDVFPEFSYLKLGMVHPLPAALIRTFASKVRKIYVIEELDPFLEEQIRALGIQVTGKEIFPYTGEFNPGIIEQAISGRQDKSRALPEIAVPPRPPNLCPGCPHRGLFYVLGKLKVFVTGDIGCYTLSFMKPLDGLHSCICMGASIGMAHGMSKALGEKGKGKIVGVIGDSTFLHSGITALLDVAYNRSDAVIVICDNRTTAMTGMQEHPATGFTLQGEKTMGVDLVSLVKSLGVESVRIVDPYDLKSVRTALKEELARSGPSVVISRRACVLFKREAKTIRKPLTIDPEKCTGCRLCLGLGCPPIAWQENEETSDPAVGVERKGRGGVAVIDRNLCPGCGLCAQLCKSGAISEEKE
ncbi:MAG: indolepyruvate ferredoxin oxidoreductase subunit alpha [Deltaproteobacteria bacterium]|nr:indolepyruvate ferredoxin oxidoreductase subunit alpha [Deltaproteobacteria bacterium]